MLSHRMMKNDRVQKGIISLLLIVGICLLAFPFFKETLLSQQLQSSQLTIVNHLPRLEEIPEEEVIQVPTISSVLANGASPITAYGFVAIEEINFQQPLLIGLTNQQLLKGGVVMFPERMPDIDNIVIIGHHLGRQTLLFGLLTQASSGMTVTLDYLGQQQDYLITEKKVVHETEIEVLDNQAIPQLTLITCAAATQTENRLVVIATPVKSKEASPTKEIVGNKELAIPSVPRTQAQKIEYQNALWQKETSRNWGMVLLTFAVVLTSLFLVNKLGPAKQKPDPVDRKGV